MKNALIIIFLLITTTLFSQKKENFVIPDSLKKMSFEELEKGFHKSKSYSKEISLYANAYYIKSKLQNNKVVIMNGLYMAAFTSNNDSTTTKYLDSIIFFTKDNPDFNFPAKAYIFKSDMYFYKDNLNKALIYILEAEKYSGKSGNVEQNMLVKQQIGLIKIELGKPKESLPLLLESYNYFKLKNHNSSKYIFSGWLLSYEYNHLKRPDNALYYTNCYLKKLKDDNTFYKFFLLEGGISYYLKKDYSRSNNFLDTSINLFNLIDDKLNLSICNYYRGENVLQGEKNILKAKKYFVKVDSILVKTNEFTSILRNNYTNLIDITKKLKEDKEQLYYLNRLIDIDNRLNKNNVILSENINKNYDTPHILAEKETIIAKINQEKQLYIGIGFVIFIGLSFSLFFLFKTKKEKQIYEERFNTIMKQPKDDLVQTQDIEIFATIKEDETAKSFDLPKEISKDLLQKLTVFEKDLNYLLPNLKLNDLAKQFETNSSYLSKTINHYKSKNFSQYLNDLRIDFTIKKLKEDKKFRRYTIKAISEEVGFSNSESFSKTFYTKTGLQPSYFIKKIENY